jgi:hypothetical protein
VSIRQGVTLFLTPTQKPSNPHLMLTCSPMWFLSSQPKLTSPYLGTSNLSLHSSREEMTVHLYDSESSEIASGITTFPEGSLQSARPTQFQKSRNPPRLKNVPICPETLQPFSNFQPLSSKTPEISCQTSQIVPKLTRAPACTKLPQAVPEVPESHPWLQNFVPIRPETPRTC